MTTYSNSRDEEIYHGDFATPERAYDEAGECSEDWLSALVRDKAKCAELEAQLTDARRDRDEFRRMLGSLKAQEPVAWARFSVGFGYKFALGNKPPLSTCNVCEWEPLYPRPLPPAPRRLTDEEIFAIPEMLGNGGKLEFANALMDALGAQDAPSMPECAAFPWRSLRQRCCAVDTACGGEAVIDKPKINQLLKQSGIGILISMKSVQHPDGSYSVELTVTGLSSEDQANAVMQHMQRLFCGEEINEH